MRENKSGCFILAASQQFDLKQQHAKWSGRLAEGTSNALMWRKWLQVEVLLLRD